MSQNVDTSPSANVNWREPTTEDKSKKRFWIPFTRLVSVCELGDAGIEGAAFAVCIYLQNGKFSSAWLKRSASGTYWTNLEAHQTNLISRLERDLKSRPHGFSLEDVQDYLTQVIDQWRVLATEAERQGQIDSVRRANVEASVATEYRQQAMKQEERNKCPNCGKQLRRATKGGDGRECPNCKWRQRDTVTYKAKTVLGWLVLLIAVALVAAFIYARSTTPQNAPPKTASEAIVRVKEYLLGNEGNKRYPGWTAAGLEHYNWSAHESTAGGKEYWNVDASSAIRLGNGPSGERTYFWALEKKTGYVFLSLYCDTSGLTMREVCIP